jgi:hypothetical protein
VSTIEYWCNDRNGMCNLGQDHDFPQFGTSAAVGPPKMSRDPYGLMVGPAWSQAIHNIGLSSPHTKPTRPSQPVTRPWPTGRAGSQNLGLLACRAAHDFGSRSPCAQLFHTADHRHPAKWRPQP